MNENEIVFVQCETAKMAFKTSEELKTYGQSRRQVLEGMTLEGLLSITEEISEISSNLLTINHLGVNEGLPNYFATFLNQRELNELEEKHGDYYWRFDLAKSGKSETLKGALISAIIAVEGELK